MVTSGAASAATLWTALQDRCTLGEASSRMVRGRFEVANRAPRKLRWAGVPRRSAEFHHHGWNSRDGTAASAGGVRRKTFR